MTYPEQSGFEASELEPLKMSKKEERQLVNLDIVTAFGDLNDEIGRVLDIPNWDGTSFHRLPLEGGKRDVVIAPVMLGRGGPAMHVVVNSESRNLDTMTLVMEEFIVSSTFPRVLHTQALPIVKHKNEKTWTLNPNSGPRILHVDLNIVKVMRYGYYTFPFGEAVKKVRRKEYPIQQDRAVRLRGILSSLQEYTLEEEMKVDDIWDSNRPSVRW